MAGFSPKNYLPSPGSAPILLILNMQKKKSTLPFPFILDLLAPVQFSIRPMFGCHAIYAGEKIVMIMRKKSDHPEANGVWIATEFRHHESLRGEFPEMGSVYILSQGKAETNWQMFHENDENFEASVTRACELIIKKDPRIGRIPKRKKKKN